MTDILQFIDELKELQTLYNTGDLRDFDFASKIHSYERELARFEDAMLVESEFFKSTNVEYNPVLEV